MVWQRMKDLALLLAICLVYFAAGKLGLYFAHIHPSATAIWPPTGIALAAVLLKGPRVWPAIFIGALCVNVTTAGTLWTSLGIAIGNTLEALIGAWLVRRYAHAQYAFDHLASTVRFFLFAALLCTMISATRGVLSLILGGVAVWADLGPIWMTWWLGDATGALIVAPFILYWARRPDIRWGRASSLEGAIMFLLLFVVSAYVFGLRIIRPPYVPYLQPYLCMPIFLWALFRFGRRAATLALIAVMLFAVDAATLELGSFQAGDHNASFGGVGHHE
ncbi:MAG: MASE1 domain-containing protein [Deltaproteobacteria bacterium]|nr:MASE1 domain-containing protein [Deltaproteobacteria bacterium]